jgi:GNAT superfamily N-acetyltransferase
MTLQAVKGATIKLRAALFNEDGSDRNPTLNLQPFMKYDRNGLNLNIEFYAGDALPVELSDYAHELCKSNMEEVYDSSGYGWDDMDKMDEFCDPASRFLVAKDEEDKPVAFVHFRFTLSGEIREEMAGDPTLLIFDLHVEPRVQRQGLGKHLMSILELISRQQKMTFLMAAVVNGADAASDFFNNKLKGFAADTGSDPDGETRTVLSKCVDKAHQKKVAEAAKAQADVAALAMQIAQMQTKQNSTEPPTKPTNAAVSITKTATEAAPPPEPPTYEVCD